MIKVNNDQIYYTEIIQDKKDTWYNIIYKIGKQSEIRIVIGSSIHVKSNINNVYILYDIYKGNSITNYYEWYIKIKYLSKKIRNLKWISRNGKVNEIELSSDIHRMLIQIENNMITHTRFEY